MLRRKWNWVDWMKWNEIEWKEMELELTGGLAASAMVARKPLWEAISKLRTNWWKPADHIKIMGKEQQQEQEPWGESKLRLFCWQEVSVATAQGRRRRRWAEPGVAQGTLSAMLRSCWGFLFFFFFPQRHFITYFFFIQLIFIKCVTFAWCQDFNAK